MSFLAISSKILIIIDDYANYNKQIFWKKLFNLWSK